MRRILFMIALSAVYSVLFFAQLITIVRMISSHLELVGAYRPGQGIPSPEFPSLAFTASFFLFLFVALVYVILMVFVLRKDKEMEEAIEKVEQKQVQLKDKVAEAIKKTEPVPPVKVRRTSVKLVNEEDGTFTLYTPFKKGKDGVCIRTDKLNVEFYEDFDTARAARDYHLQLENAEN